MRKLLRSNVLIFILMLLLAAGGFALRCRQLGHELLPDGTLVKGSCLHIILGIQSGIAVLLLVACLRPLEKKTAWKEFGSGTKALWVVQILAALALGVGNVMGLAKPVVLSSAAGNLANAMGKILPYAGLVAAVCIFLFAIQAMRGKQPSAVLYILVSLYLVIRLIMDFQSWNTDPSIHDYAYGLLAAICTMLGTYHLAGFGLDRGKRRMTLFWLLLGLLFCSIHMADAVLRDGLREILLNGALLLVLLTGSLFLLFPRQEA